MDKNKDVTLAEAARQLGVCKGTVTNWIKRGICPHYTKGRYRHLTQAHVDILKRRLDEMRREGLEE